METAGFYGEFEDVELVGEWGAVVGWLDAGVVWSLGLAWRLVKTYLGLLKEGLE